MSASASPDRVFLAGATGVAGRLLLPQLTARGRRITAAARTPEKRGRPSPDRPAPTGRPSHEDAAAAVLSALEVPAGAYNVCDDEPLTRRALADVLAETSHTQARA